MSLSLNISLKAIKISILLAFTPLVFFGQSLTGLWTGAVYNDSTTIRKEQLFEIALTEYKGKVYGYSRSEFIVNDTLYYIIKRVKGTIEGDVCEVKDEEIIAYNFRGKLDKGIKVTSTFYRNKQDSTWYLAGSWKTNQTKKFYAVSGKISLAEEKDLQASKIFPHLEELNMTKDIGFYNERKTVPVVMKNIEPDHIRLATLIKAEKQSPIIATNAGLPDVDSIEVNTIDVSSSKTIRTNAETVKTKSMAVPTKTDGAVVKAEVNDESFRINKVSKPPEPEIVVEKPVAKTKLPEAKQTEIKIQPVAKNVTPVSTNPEIKKRDAVAIPTKTTTDPIAKAEVTEIKKPSALAVPTKTTADPTHNAGVTEIKKPVTVAVPTKTTADPVAKAEVTEIKKPSAPIEMPQTLAGRKSEYSQTVSYSSDSLELSLYDNGEIDGDTVSVFMNGQVILSKQGLKASAIKKTIYLPKGTNDEFTLVLFADNLGKYPPNTGLLVVHDGEDVYNIRFSADFQKNAGVVFKRK